jgi:hypothetical protein
MDLMHIAIGLAGIAAGFGLNQMKLKLSTKLEGVFSNVGKLSGNTARWVGWLMAVAVYAFIAMGGAYTILSKTKMQGLGGAKPIIGAFLGGFGTGGLLSELLFQMPDLSSLGSA